MKPSKNMRAPPDFQDLAVPRLALEFSITGMSPRVGGAGRVTTRIQGARFRPGTQVLLRGTGQSVFGEIIRVVNSTELVVKWDLKEVSAGPVDVVVQNGFKQPSPLTAA